MSIAKDISELLSAGTETEWSSSSDLVKGLRNKHLTLLAAAAAVGPVGAGAVDATALASVTGALAFAAARLVYTSHTTPAGCFTASGGGGTLTVSLVSSTLMS